MKFKIDQIQIEEAHRVAAVNVADTLGIGNIHKKSTAELLVEIRVGRSVLVAPLNEYFLYYDNWAYYYMEHNEDELTMEEEFQLQNLLTIRNHKRDELGHANVEYRRANP